jgi:hypothetical protein
LPFFVYIVYFSGVIVVCNMLYLEK